MNNKDRIPFFLIIFFLTFSEISFPQAGQLDSTFGQNGLVTTAINGHGYAYSAAIQSDGKIVAAGYSDNAGDYDFALVRYNSNGSLDNSFGSNGVVTTTIEESNGIAYSASIQSDGKIIAAGYADNGSDEDFALVRYNSNGALDNSFGTNGVVTTTIGTSTDVVNFVATQSDGKIIAAGYSRNESYNEFALARYNSNGSLDSSFGSNGVVTTPIGSSANVAYSAAIQSDGKIVAAGYSSSGFTLARYNSNGYLDNSFGSNGVVTTTIGIVGDAAYSVAIQNDEKIVAAGNSYNGNDYDFAIVRYNPNGSLDNSFGTNGVVTIPIGASNDYARSAAIQSDGKIIAAGYSRSGSNYDFALIRYNSNGSLDNSFGTNGVVTTPIGKSSDYAQSVAIQSDKKIIAAGYSFDVTDIDFALVRYTADPATGLEEENTNGVPVAFLLEQNYPNPFNPATTISFNLPKQSHVTLEVYNILGQEVAVLINEVKKAGNFKVQFDASSLPSGIYFYQLNAGEFVQSKKMILLK